MDIKYLTPESQMRLLNRHYKISIKDAEMLLLERDVKLGHKIIDNRWRKR